MSIQTDLVEMPAMQTKLQLAMEEEWVKPSPELIPDEYEHDQNEKGMIYIFSDCDKIDIRNIRQHVIPTLTSIKFNVTEDAHGLEFRTKTKLTQGLNKVVTEIERVNPSSLIILFYAQITNGDNIVLEQGESVSTSHILKHFTAEKCPNLRNKPKIFIFEGRYQTNMMSTDNKRYSLSHAYDLPAEADILFVFKLREMHADDRFMEQLCENVVKFGAKEDIKTLIMLTENLHKRPLIISTLTRKFYLQPSQKRGHFLEHHSQIDEIYRYAIKLQEKVSKAS